MPVFRVAGDDYIAASETMPKAGWTVHVLLDTAELRRETQLAVASLFLMLGAVPNTDWLKDCGVLLDDSAYLSRGILRRATGGIDSAELTEGSSTVMWMEGETRHMSVDSDGDFSAVRLRTNGLRLGIDHRFGDFSVGAAFGHGWSKFHTTDRANEADAKGLHLGLYGLADFEGTKLAAGWTWSRYKVTGDRVADYGSISEALDSRWTGKANRLFAEVSRAAGSWSRPAASSPNRSSAPPA